VFLGFKLGIDPKPEAYMMSHDRVCECRQRGRPFNAVEIRFADTGFVEFRLNPRP